MSNKELFDSLSVDLFILSCLGVAIWVFSSFLVVWGGLCYFI